MQHVQVLKRLGGALSVEGPGSPLTATISLPLTVEPGAMGRGWTVGAVGAMGMDRLYIISYVWGMAI